MTRSRRRIYRRTGTGMLRAGVSVSVPALPDWPGPGSSAERYRCWLTGAWADESLRQAVTAASADLARRVEAILAGHRVDARRARRAALAVARYAIRFAHRSTPYGLFAGVGLVDFGELARVRVGDGHAVAGRADPVSLEAAISALEADGAATAHVQVCVNTLAAVRGGRVRVPSEGAAEFSLAQTPAVELVLQEARAPISRSALLGKLAAEFPQAGHRRLDAFVTELLRTGLLRSALRAPATVVDPASAVPAGVLASRDRCREAVDVRLDARVRLPETVAVEMETAATVLARLTTHPAGTPAWRHYIERFTDRFGEDAEVSLEELVDPARGLGLPDGFGTVSEPPRPMSRRDRLLLELAGVAAVEGRRTVILTEAMVEELEAAAGGPATVTAPHLEVCAQVQAHSIPALERGNFRIRVHTVSRAAGAMTGRFWHLLPQAAAQHASLPTVDPEATLAQLSFHPSRVRADLLTRAPQILPTLVSVGEFRDGKDGVLSPSDLIVGLGGGHLYLAVAATGQRLELLTPTALNFVWNNYTPPLVRFLAEISRAATPQVTGLDWGAAWTLPFTPALHYRRSILTAARWRLQARTLPDRTAPMEQWAAHLHAWRHRAKVPDRVLLTVDDQQLLLDLQAEMDLDLLRTHLGTAPAAVLYDAAPTDADGWIGGRAHSIVLPLRAHR
ncbi:lantibiotic dehydratase family protein [Actinomadura geliboluensis]|uniref:lantibiotic dehydratase family protein n=1 Tax=Actinomadura geliboluensis TaxID=882440 RepID=UPI00262CA145|nr:lantibiotic dehydratase family protein [Actinomadura geliboluensis]